VERYERPAQALPDARWQVSPRAEALRDAAARFRSRSVAPQRRALLYRLNPNKLLALGDGGGRLNGQEVIREIQCGLPAVPLSLPITSLQIPDAVLTGQR